MRVLHYEKNFHYTDRELLHVVRKVGKLATYCKRLKNEDSTIRVEAEARQTKKARDQVKVTIVVELPHKTFTAESRKYDVIEAVDRCTEKLEPQVKKYKEKNTSVQRSRKVRRQKAA